MRTTSIILLADVTVLASVTGVSAATTGADLAKVAPNEAAPSIESTHATRFLRKRKARHYTDTESEERNGLAVLQGLKTTFEKVADLPFDKAWHNLQGMGLSWTQREALLTLHKLDAADRAAVLKLIT
ncbi:hypothetical protein P3T76_006641 [Phytophthora citrophthora]|uniref:RxLR effector protein n=1 Tax=Phytophthora citrophthora TaxID=4793 RepID=A0AAD9GPR1_9STRA|nr:hypothetical protein P3T76_006641 [Phytophthora citrophthora]